MHFKIIFISGPSTIGKNPLINAICKNYNYKFVVPVTTRKKRVEEIDKQDYFFLSKKDFKQGIRKNLFIEWEYKLNNYYGFFKESFNENNNLITHSLSIMALKLKQKLFNVTTIFLNPINKDHIIYTLKKIYKDEELNLRILHLNDEISQSDLFDITFNVNSGIDLLNDKNFIDIL